MQRTRIIPLTAAVVCAGLTLSALAEEAGFEAVNSKVIESVRRTGSEFALKFRDGRIVAHDDVPDNVYQDFMDHRLKGGYYLGAIEKIYPARELQKSTAQLMEERAAAENAAAEKAAADKTAADAKAKMAAAPVAAAIPTPEPEPEPEPEPTPEPAPVIEVPEPEAETVAEVIETVEEPVEEITEIVEASADAPEETTDILGDVLSEEVAVADAAEAAVEVEEGLDDLLEDSDTDTLDLLDDLLK